MKVDLALVLLAHIKYIRELEEAARNACDETASDGMHWAAVNNLRYVVEKGMTR